MTIVRKALLKKIFQKIGFEISRYQAQKNHEFDTVISLSPNLSSKGDVLVSYVLIPFLDKYKDQLPVNHTNIRESLMMVQTFLNLGYNVDIIDYRNIKFIPEKQYSIFVSARVNFDHYAKKLDSDCIKIAHFETAHWLFNNTNVLRRCLDIQEKRKITLRSYKSIEENFAVENADYAVVKGNDFTAGTYSYAGTPLFKINNPAINHYPWDNRKNFEKCKYHYVWMGSRGFVHKGLDIVLEAFAEMPEYKLYVCAPIEQEPRFQEEYNKELYQTSNIETAGWVDVTGDKFKNIVMDTIAIVYPSIAEGQAGSVVTCMHAGLIPIMSRESGVDAGNFGFYLKNCSKDAVKESINRVAQLRSSDCKQLARKTWEYARQYHSGEYYSIRYKEIIETILKENNLQKKTLHPSYNTVTG